MPNAAAPGRDLAKSTRQIAAKSTMMRTRLIEAAHEIFKDEGCTAISACSVAARVNLTDPTVHCHIGSIDDLVIEVLDHAALLIGELEAAFSSEDPLQVIW